MRKTRPNHEPPVFGRETRSNASYAILSDFPPGSGDSQIDILTPKQHK